MEVLTFFTINKEILNAFDKFIYEYDKLVLSSKDDDTAYFKLNGNSEIYYHFVLNDIEEEFSYNYSEKDITTIKLFFGKEDFYSFDLSYRQESFLRKFIIDFKNHLSQKAKKLENEVLLSHPHLGLMTLSSIT
jgi:hypothetical protein